MFSIKDILFLTIGILFLYIFSRLNRIEKWNNHFDPIKHCKQGSEHYVTHIKQCGGDLVKLPITIPIKLFT